MIFDRLYHKYYAPKKKKSSAVAWIIGALAFIALCPLAVKRDIKKGEWGIASLLLFIGCKPSEKNEGRRELTVSFPGYPYVKSICMTAFGCKRSTAKAFDEAGDMAEDEDYDLGELIDEDGDDTDPEVIISEE